MSDALRFEVASFGIDVVVIEPGLIRTEFADVAVASMGPRAGPARYATFNGAVARATADAYRKGPLARLAGEPDDVARTIKRALAARRPRTRYAVSA